MVNNRGKMYWALTVSQALVLASHKHDSLALTTGLCSSSYYSYGSDHSWCIGGGLLWGWMYKSISMCRFSTCPARTGLCEDLLPHYSSFNSPPCSTLSPSMPSDRPSVSLHLSDSPGKSSCGLKREGGSADYLLSMCSHSPGSSQGCFYVASTKRRAAKSV